MSLSHEDIKALIKVLNSDIVIWNGELECARVKDENNRTRWWARIAHDLLLIEKLKEWNTRTPSIEDIVAAVEVKKTCVGPELYIAGVCVNKWFGTAYNQEALELADSIGKAISSLATNPSEP